MSGDQSICSNFINRSSENRIQLAAFLVLFSISLFIESPVIDLLATSTTLAKGPKSFAAIRRFSILTMFIAGAVHLVIAATPLLDIILSKFMGQDPEVVRAAKIPMLIMVAWSPAIGWRRHVQGLLIRQGVTNPIGWGTACRLVSLIAFGSISFYIGHLEGAEIGAIALVGSVVLEALFIHVAWVVIRKRMVWDETQDVELSQREIAQFHFPLTASTMVVLLSLPMISAAIARSPQGILAMNAWQVSASLAFLLRSVGFALPEVVIANYSEGPAHRLLFRFCASVGICFSAIILFLTIFRIDQPYFSHVNRADTDVVTMAHLALSFTLLLPLATSITNFWKGVLTSRKVTLSRLIATLASFLVLAICLLVGVQLKANGVVSSAIAVTVSQAVEGFVLYLLSKTKLRVKLTQTHKNTT